MIQKDHFLAVKAILDNISRWHNQELEQQQKTIRRLRSALSEIYALQPLCSATDMAFSFAKQIAEKALEETNEQ